MKSVAVPIGAEAFPAPCASVIVTAAEPEDRKRIINVLDELEGLSVGAEDSAQRLVEGTKPWSVLVLHCESVGSHELALIKKLRERHADGLIVAVCESANGRNVRRAVDAGVDGIVLAERLESALPCTVAAVLARQTVVPRELRAGARKPSLSFREKQILGMVVMGFTNNEIGARLFLAESTVKSHLSSAFTKLGVRSRSEAAAMILDPQGSLGTGILAVTPDVESRAA